jgi:hypothetical protein
MEEKNYLVLRKRFFWFFSLLFVVATPIVTLYSLGYKLDLKTKKFLRTGTIFIKTLPDGAQISMDDSKLNKTTPGVVTELPPRVYDIVLEKEGFYPYQILEEVRPSVVSKIDAVLVPKIEGMQKLKLNCVVYKFFLSKRFLGERIFLFTDKGIFLIDRDFKNPQKICSTNLGFKAGEGIEGVLDDNTRLIFWDSATVWMADISFLSRKQETPLEVIYSTQKGIKNIFLALKERYLIIHDGNEIIVLDTHNHATFFSILTLQAKRSEIFYDSSTETLYLKNTAPGPDDFSLFKVEFLPSFLERLYNEKTP